MVSVAVVSMVRAPQVSRVVLYMMRPCPCPGPALPPPRSPGDAYCGDTYCGYTYCGDTYCGYTYRGYTYCGYTYRGYTYCGYTYCGSTLLTAALLTRCLPPPRSPKIWPCEATLTSLVGQLSTWLGLGSGLG